MLKRTYKIEKKVIAKNRKPQFEQSKATPALNEWYESLCEEVGTTEARQRLSQVKVEKSQRRYNNRARILPGAVFLYRGKQYVLTGSLTNGQYFRAYGQGTKNFPAKQCAIVARKSLIYIA